MTNSMFFDDSFPALVQTLTSLAGREFVESGTALRDATGRLTFVAARPATDDAERASLGAALIDRLGAYARVDRPISFKGDGATDAILDAAERLPVLIGDTFCFLIDRRIVGSGWLEAPSAALMLPPRIVFATLKGGVGRSTALAVAATDLARRNRNVLVVDLDLEAPGLGDLLLDDDQIPTLGAIDYLVENGIGSMSDSDMASFIGSSHLTDAGGGRVDVLPALGRRSMSHPENILPKLSRAMIEDVVDGYTVSVSQQISSMISNAVKRDQYDVVLVDSRAGLAELAAPAVLGLGATVLLFGTAQKQTYEGYRALFAGLQLLAQRDAVTENGNDWRSRLRPVYAKASLSDASGRRFLDDIYELYSAHLYDAEDARLEGLDAFRFAREDKSAPHWPLVVPFNQGFIDFDPSRVPGQLSQGFYEQAYRPFLDGLEAIVAESSDEPRYG